MRISCCFLLFCLGFIFNNPSVFAVDSNARLLQETERLRQQSEQEKKFNNLKNAFETGREEIIEDKKVQASQGSCFVVNEFEIEGATKLSESAKNKFFKEYKKTCVSVGTLDIFIRKLTQWYVKKGFVTARVYIPKQNLKSGTLRLLVVEGKVEKIILNNDTSSDRRRVWSAVPIKIGNSLLLKEVERGVEHLKHPQSAEATMSIEPGTKSGQSILRFKTVDRKAHRLSLGYDNLGQESTGENRVKIQGGFDNLLSLNEMISALVLSNHDFWNNDRGSQVYMFSYTMPLRMWRVNMSLTHTEYNTTSTGSFGLELKTSGESNKIKFDLERRLIKTHKTQLDFTTGLSYYDTNSYLFDVLNPASTYDLSNLWVGVKLDFAWNKSYFMTHLKYTKGVAMFGANEDENDIGIDVPHAQFDKYTLSLTGMRTWKTGDQSALRLTSNAMAQYSPDTLYSAENIIIGDRYSVRGFKTDSGYGNSGFYIQNDLAFDMMNNVGDSWWVQPFKHIQPFVGLDGGSVKNFNGTDKLVGWAVGIKSIHNRFNAELSYSGSIEAPENFKKEHVVYLTITANVF